MSIKTDLAKEIIERISPEYSKRKIFFRGETKITRIAIETAEESALTEKPKGRYVTVEADFPHLPFEKFDREAEALAAELKTLLPEKGDILFAALGNPFLTADSLGPLISQKCLAGDFGERKLFVLSAEAEGKTAIPPQKLISAAVKELKPAAVIIADSLAAENISHICRTVQITDAGIAPGSGVSERKTAITKETLGVPTVAVGTPTVIRYPGKSGVFVSPNDIDILINRASSLIAAGISLAVFPSLGIGFIKETFL